VIYVSEGRFIEADERVDGYKEDVKQIHHDAEKMEEVRSSDRGVAFEDDDPGDLDDN
jgi:hypothetical protein